MGGEFESVPDRSSSVVSEEDLVEDLPDDYSIGTTTTTEMAEEAGGAAAAVSGERLSQRERRAAVRSMGKQLLRTLESVVRGSSYGKLTEYLANIGLDTEALGLTLPKIIFTGDESHGKSATLARLLGLDILPSAHGLTTRCPIMVRLKRVPGMPAGTQTILLENVLESGEGPFRDVSAFDEADVRALVLEQMAKVCEGEETGVSMKELHLEIHSSTLPDLELVDLPGVVGWPDTTRRETEALVREYAKHDHTLVICVVSAALDSWRNCRTLGLLGSSGLNCYDRTIVATTKWDNVPSTSLSYRCDEVFNGGLGEGQQPAVADMVALINRHHTERLTMAEAQRKEMDWFSLFLPQLDPADVGIVALLLAIDRNFDEVIKRRWLARVVERVREALDDIRLQTEAQGPAPGSYHGDVSLLVQQVQQCRPMLLEALVAECADFVQSETLELDAISSGEAAPFSPLNLGQVRARMAQRVEAQRRIDKQVERLVRVVTARVEDVLQDRELPGVTDTHHLARFPEFGECVRHVISEALQLAASQAFNEAVEQLDLHWTQVAGQDYGRRFSTRLPNALADVLMRHVVLEVEDLMTEKVEGEGQQQGGAVSDLQKRVQQPPSTALWLQQEGEDDEAERQRMAAAMWGQAMLVEETGVATRRAELGAAFDRHTETLVRLEQMANATYGQAFAP